MREEKSKSHQRTEEVVKNLDIKGLMQAFREGDKAWHEKEWQEFIDKIRAEEREKTLKDVGKILKRELDYYGNADELIAVPDVVKIAKRLIKEPNV